MSQFKLSILSLLFSVICVTVGLTLGIYFEYSWFGRFGALVVLCGLISEYSLLQKELKELYSALEGQGATQDGNTGIPDIRPSSVHRWLSNSSHIVIIAGTIVWGFGDYFLSRLLCDA